MVNTLNMINIEILISEYRKLISYLELHEDDIALGINDFGDLKGIYISILKKEPKSDYIT